MPLCASVRLSAPECPCATECVGVRLSARAIAAGQPLGIESACVYGGAPREMQISRLAEGVMIATDDLG